MKPWLRWVLVVPAAIGAFAGVQIVIALLSLVGDFFWSTGSAHWTEFVNSIAGPYAFVYYGAKTAPKHQFFTSICLTVLFAVLAAVIVTAYFMKGFGNGLANFWLVVCSLVGVVTTIVTCIEVRKIEDQTNEELRLVKETESKRPKQSSVANTPSKFSNN